MTYAPDELVLVTHPDFDPDAGMIRTAFGTIGVGGGATAAAFSVAVSERQRVVGFPKFSTIGIGFETEDDGNTNLPYARRPDLIADHIARNRLAAGDAVIRRDTVEAAIGFIREAVGAHPDYGVECMRCLAARRPDAAGHWEEACTHPLDADVSAYWKRVDAETEARGRTDGWLNPEPEEIEL